MEASEVAPAEQLLAQAGFDLVSQAFAIILGLDAANITDETNFFEEGAGSLQVRALQDYLENDHGQERVLRQKLEQHVLFTNPKVGDIVRLLVENSKNVPKSDEELLEGARAVLKKAYSEILGLNEEDVTDDTDFFAAGGGSLQVRILIDYLKSDKGQDMSLQQAIEQHELFASPTVLAVANILVKRAKAVGDSPTKPQKSIESVAAELVVEYDKFYPASYAQEQTYVLNASGAGAAYNMPWIVDFKGKFDKEAMIRAHDLVVKREQPLRTILRLNPSLSKTSDGTVQQCVLPQHDSRNYWDLCEHNAWTYEEAISILEKAQDYNFDLTQTPVSRLHIVQINNDDGRHLVMCNSHHVHHDTGSVVTYRRHVMEAYIAICRKEQVDVPDGEPTMDYLTYAIWQRQVLTPRGRVYQNQLAYWKEELNGARALTFPNDPTATADSQGGGGDMVTLRIEPDVAAKWKQSLSAHGCTPFMGGMTLLHILLSRWFNEKDIVSGAAIANRDPHPNYADRLGCFRNVLPIRSNRAGSDNCTYVEMLTQIKTKIIQSWSAKEIPYHLVIANMADKSFRGFNVMYAFQDAEWHTLSMSTADLGFEAKVAYLTKDTTKFDVHLMLRWNADGGVDGDLIYSASKFGRSTMQRIADAFVTVATFVAEQDPTTVAQQAILSLPMASSNDLSTAKYTWNDSAPEKPFPTPQSVATTVLHAINGHSSSSIAVEEAASGVSYTYLELSNTSSCIASAIQSVCKKEQPRIALIFNRGFAMYATLLGVLSAGGCIVPIDASNTPVDRVLFMLSDADADLVIFDDANEHFVQQLKEKGGTDQEVASMYMSYREIFEEGTNSRIENANRSIVNVDSDSVAYILYTSGTTGQAKGVMISHANIHNMIYWWISLIELNCHDKFLHFSSFSFVMSLRQIFPVFVAGATVVAPSSGTEFESAIHKCQVTKMALTPSALSTLTHGNYSSLRVIQVAGEACPLKLANEWASRLDAFFIGLGPTELTGHACCGQFRVGDRVNIGFPVSNAAVYILNEAGEIQPPGVIGELCVAGENVSSGYLNRDELTKKHFVANKFDSSKPKMYKVGDLARRLEDGRIEFIGREDDQVKVRGFRIELQEIANTMNQLEVVHEAHIVPSKVKTEVTLVAYVRLCEGDKVESVAIEEIKRHLIAVLPAYMVPTFLIPVEKFPLNKNGKLDRSKLPPIPSTQNQDNVSDSVDREDPVVEMVLLVFANELKSEKETIWKERGQSFFEVGGTSLSAVQVLRQISDALSIELKVTDLIQQPTILDFIKHVIEVDESANSFPSTSLELNVCGGSRAKSAGRDLNWFVFQLLHVMSMVTIMVFSIIMPLTIGVLTLLSILDKVGFPAVLPLLPSVYAVIAISNLIITSLAMKLFPISNTPSSYPLTSIQFITWLLHKKMTQITTAMFWPTNNTKAINLAFRFLGARIGSDVTIDNLIVDIPSLVKIEDKTSIGSCTRLVCGEMRDDTLFVCPVEVGRCVKTEPRSSITPGSTIPRGCVVRAWACVTSALGGSDGKCKEIAGSPATYGEEIKEVKQHVPPKTQTYSYLLCQVILMYLLSMLLFFGVGVSCVLGISIVRIREGDLAQLLYFAIAGLPVALMILLLVVIITKRTILNRQEPGSLHTGTFFFLRVWLVDTLLLSPMLALALEYLLPPSLHHYFLIAMGGSAVGCHTFWNSPQLRAGCEHITIGEALHSGFMQIWDCQVVSEDGISFQPISIGDHCTIGQRTVVMPGCTLEDRVTCGSESILLKDTVVEMNGTVVGNPPTVFFSTQRSSFAVRQLQSSVAASMSLRGQKSTKSISGSKADGSVHAFNVIAVILNLLKLPFVVGVFLAYYFLMRYVLPDSLGNSPIIKECVAAVLTWQLGVWSIALCLSFATISGFASFQSGATGYYTPRFIVWWFFLWLNRFCSGLLLYPFHGTFLFSFWLRLTGAKIGRKCFVDPGPAGLFELDGIEVGDECFLLSPNVHGHFVDHGKLQFATVLLGRKARVNDGATIMPFTEIGEEVTLLSQCTTIKGSVLQKSGIYMGNTASIVMSCMKDHDENLRRSITILRASLHSTRTEPLIDANEVDLRIVLVGQQAFGAAVLQRLLDEGDNVVAVCGNPTKPGQPDDPLIAVARARGIEIFQPKSWKTPESLEKMKSFHADLCLMAYVTKFFPLEVANVPTYGSACYHPSLLPMHRGPSAISWAIATGKKTTGITIFEPTDGLDEGPILLQKQCDIGEDETMGDLYTKKLFPMGVDAMIEIVDLVKSEQLTKREQVLSEGSYESWFRNEAVLLDFKKNVDSVYNVIRAANPTPGAVASYDNGNKTVKIFDSRKAKDLGLEPGHVVEINDEGVLVQADGGCILIKRVESSDGKRLQASKWACEAGLVVGSLLGL